MIERFVEAKIGRLVGDKLEFLVGEDPEPLPHRGVAALAQLRRAARRPYGASPEVWGITLDGIPDNLGEPIRVRIEQVMHLTLTQFALHQQSQSTRMHQKEEHFGQAVRRLADATADRPHESPTYARFMAMARSTNLQALSTHARGVISQLRSRSLPFDYCEYAADLYRFLTPGRAVEVQRRWGRHFHALESPAPEGELS